MTCSYLSVLIGGGIPIVLDGSNHTRASLTPILMHNMLNLNWIKRKPEEEALQMERRELHHVSLFH